MNDLATTTVTAGAPQRLIQDIPLDLITSRPQVRRHFDENELAELGRTFREVGVKQPIQVRRDGERYIIVFGERRWRASKLAGLATILAIIIDGAMSDAEVLQTQLTENVQRAALNALDFAEGIRALMDATGCNATEAAKKIGKSKATVSKALALLALPADQKALVASGDIGIRAGHAMARSGAGQNEPKAKSDRKHKFTAPLGGGGVVTFTGIELTFEAVISAMDEFRRHANAAVRQHVSFETFLAVLRDQAKRSTAPSRA